MLVKKARGGEGGVSSRSFFWVSEGKCGFGGGVRRMELFAGRHLLLCDLEQLLVLGQNRVQIYSLRTELGKSSLSRVILNWASRSLWFCSEC